MSFAALSHKLRSLKAPALDFNMRVMRAEFEAIMTGVL